jgi:LDH2 family malate/lactate/ureidoglycolate dehydrogenase
MGENMPTLTAKQLEQITSRIFEAAGVPADRALQVATSLVESNLVGHDSHGVIRIMNYLRYLRTGVVDPHAEIEVLQETATTALVDAHWAIGQVAATKGMAMAIEKARQSQISVVALRHCGHIGRLGEYAMMAAEQGLMGAVLCSTGPACAAPYGGIGRVLATNPIAVAVPAGDRPPFLMDVATTVVAEGKLKLARSKKEPVPLGWILDKEGNPTTNAEDFYAGGVLLPFGGHKGYALCLLVEILGAVLTGQGSGSSPAWRGGAGVVMWAMDLQTFGPLAQFGSGVDALFEGVKAGPTARGVDEILIPGEPEFRAKQKRLRDGIPVPESVWQDIVREAEGLGVQVTEELAE